ncbi:hypothetical protein F5148DRAFT_275943 [Russula earlei]|uniref:Uncharacterized protein n=1 Tax=Russula earlei TaxID=71964 RepID=A0ACC0U2H7_9AGAM|nr:hypothetical protein F5148DRAFT_275943 [Russula earlei]
MPTSRQHDTPSPCSDHTSEPGAQSSSVQLSPFNPKPRFPALASSAIGVAASQPRRPSCPFHSAYHLPRTRSRSAPSIMPIPYHYYDRDLRGFVAASSGLRSRDLEDIFQYHSEFRAVCGPFVRACRLSHEDCNELFWLGLHPQDDFLMTRPLAHG